MIRVWFKPDSCAVTNAEWKTGVRHTIEDSGDLIVYADDGTDDAVEEKIVGIVRDGCWTVVEYVDA